MVETDKEESTFQSESVFRIFCSRESQISYLKYLKIPCFSALIPETSAFYKLIDDNISSLDSEKVGSNCFETSVAEQSCSKGSQEDLITQTYCIV